MPHIIYFPLNLFILIPTLSLRQKVFASNVLHIISHSSRHVLTLLYRDTGRCDILMPQKWRADRITCQCSSITRYWVIRAKLWKVSRARIVDDDTFPHIVVVVVARSPLISIKSGKCEFIFVTLCKNFKLNFYFFLFKATSGA